jgi:hypothetical protein
MLGNDGLEIPENNREIALHLRAIRASMSDMSDRLDALETSVSERRFKMQDIFMSALILPLLGGILLFLLTKALS